MSDENQPAESVLVVTASWAALLLGLFCTGFWAWQLPRDRDASYATLHDFHMEINGWTKLVLSIPEGAMFVTAAVLAMAMIAAQLGFKRKITAMAVHLLVVIICCVGFIVYRQACVDPVFELIREMSTPR